MRCPTLQNPGKIEQKHQKPVLPQLENRRRGRVSRRITYQGEYFHRRTGNIQLRNYRKGRRLHRGGAQDEFLHRKAVHRREHTEQEGRRADTAERNFQHAIQSDEGFKSQVRGVRF